LCFRFNGVHDKGGGDEKGEENKDDREDIILFCNYSTLGS
jgi:hypothetical protein